MGNRQFLRSIERRKREFLRCQQSRERSSKTPSTTATSTSKAKRSIQLTAEEEGRDGDLLRIPGHARFGFGCNHAPTMQVYAGRSHGRGCSHRMEGRLEDLKNHCLRCRLDDSMEAMK